MNNFLNLRYGCEKDMLFDLEQLDKDQNVFSNNRNIECPDINLHESIILIPD